MDLSLKGNAMLYTLIYVETGSERVDRKSEIC